MGNKGINTFVATYILLMARQIEGVTAAAADTLLKGMAATQSAEVYELRGSTPQESILRIEIPHSDTFPAGAIVNITVLDWTEEAIDQLANCTSLLDQFEMLLHYGAFDYLHHTSAFG